MLAPNDIRISTSLCKREEENIATESVPKCRLNSMSETHNEKRKLFFCFLCWFSKKESVENETEKRRDTQKSLIISLLCLYGVYTPKSEPFELKKK